MSNEKKEPNITHVIITCEKNRELSEAQRLHCFDGRQVHVETDEDDLDVTLRESSTNTKLLRALNRTDALLTDADWLFIVDDDCWINADALQRACSRLNPKLPFISAMGCIRTGLGKHSLSYRDVHGTEKHEAAMAWWDKVAHLPSFSTYYCGGAGMLLSKTLVDAIRQLVTGSNSVIPELSELCTKALSHEGHVAALPHDKLMSILINTVRRKRPVMQRLLRGLSLHDKQYELRWPKPLNDWEAEGTGVANGFREKRVCDINLRMPMTPDGEPDFARAVHLQTSNVRPRPGQNNQHIVPGQANLVSWHGFKGPDMYEAMQEAMDDVQPVSVAS